MYVGDVLLVPQEHFDEVDVLVALLLSNLQSHSIDVRVQLLLPLLRWVAGNARDCAFRNGKEYST
jgi:hypothetical protein